MGVYVSFDETAPSDPTMYTWSKIKGDNGSPGATGRPGSPGKDGTSNYTHWAFSNDGGKTLLPVGQTGAWIGYYVDSDPNGLEIAMLYTWVKIKGDSGFTVSLSNDAHTVPTDSNGENPNLSGAETTISVTEGILDVTSEWTASILNEVGLTGSLSGMTYTITGITEDSAYVDFELSKEGYTSLIKRFQVSRTKSGVPGKAGTAYWLITSVAAIVKKQDNTFNPNNITVFAMCQSGGSPVAQYSTRFGIFINGSSSPAYQSTTDEASKTYVIPSGTESLRFVMYKDGGTDIILDEEVVSVVSDGQDGQTLSLSINGGTRGIMYNKDGLNPVPTMQAFSCDLYLGSELVTPESYRWYTPATDSLLSGSSTSATFTPTIEAEYDDSKGNNVIFLEIGYQGQTIRQTAVINVNKSSIPGKTYVLNMTGGKTSITYDTEGNNPFPSNLGTFTAELYEEGVLLTENIEYSWSVPSANSILTLPQSHTSKDFTPVILQSGYDVSEHYDNTIALIAKYNGQLFYSSQPISVTKLGTQGEPGQDSYTVYLSNQNDSFICDADGNILNETAVATYVYAYKGAKEMTPVIGDLPTITGLTLSKMNNQITITASTGNTLTSSGTLDIPVSVDGVPFVLTFSWTKLCDGSAFGNDIKHILEVTEQVESTVDKLNGEISNLVRKDEIDSYIDKNGTITTIKSQYSEQAITLNSITQRVGTVESTLGTQNDKIEAHETSINQTAETLSLIASGTTESGLVITESFIALMSQAINIDGVVNFMNSVADSTKTMIDGGRILTNSITTDQLAADAITSKNFAEFNVKGLYTKTGTQLLLTDGAFRTPNFVIDSSGNAYFKGNGEFEGKIVATSGNIAGFDIQSTYIAKGTTKLHGANNSVYLGTDGISCGTKFWVDANGILHATDGVFSGDISGSTITGSHIISSTISSGNGNFTVDEDGKLTAYGAVISGEIIANEGTIGGFKIGQTQLYSTDNNIILSSSDGINLGGGAFTVGMDGKLYANNANITGNIVATSITADTAYYMYYDSTDTNERIIYTNGFNSPSGNALTKTLNMQLLDALGDTTIQSAIRYSTFRGVTFGMSFLNLLAYSTGETNGTSASIQLESRYNDGTTDKQYSTINMSADKINLNGDTEVTYNGNIISIEGHTHPYIEYTKYRVSLASDGTDEAVVPRTAGTATNVSGHVSLGRSDAKYKNVYAVNGNFDDLYINGEKFSGKGIGALTFHLYSNGTYTTSTYTGSATTIEAAAYNHTHSYTDITWQKESNDTFPTSNTYKRHGHDHSRLICMANGYYLGFSGTSNSGKLLPFNIDGTTCNVDLGSSERPFNALYVKSLTLNGTTVNLSNYITTSTFNSHTHPYIEYTKYRVSLAKSGDYEAVVPRIAGTTTNVSGEVSLGTSGAKYKDVYAVNGYFDVVTATSITQTSDEYLKENATPYDDRWEKAFLELNPVTYRFKNFSANDSHDRKHGGLLARETERILLKHGISIEEAGFICKDELETPNKAGQMEEYSMRYGELPSWIIHMVQKLYARVEELEEKLKASIS